MLFSGISGGGLKPSLQSLSSLQADKNRVKLSVETASNVFFIFSYPFEGIQHSCCFAQLCNL